MQNHVPDQDPGATPVPLPPRPLRLSPGIVPADRDESVDRLLVRVGHQLVLLRIPDIDWFETEGKYVRIHSRDHAYLLRRSLADIEKKLQGRPFLRVNRFVLVNIDRIREFRLRPYRPMEVVLGSGQTWPLGRRYRRNLEKALGAA